MNVLVTGGAGFIGSHLVDLLVARGHQVTVLDNLYRGDWGHLERHLRSRSVRLLEKDVRDFESVYRAGADAEVVYHLAAQANVMGALSDPDYSLTTNVLGTFNVLKAAASHGARRVVFSSSREVYGEPEQVPVREETPLAPKSPYGASKVAGEAYCRAWAQTNGLETFVLRLANVYGLRDRDRVIPRWLERAGRGQPLDLFGGDQVLDFISVERAVDALLAAADRPVDGPVNVGSGRGTSLKELAARILEVSDSPSQLRLLPARQGEVVKFVADVRKMRRLLGVEPPKDPLGDLVALSRPGANGGSRK